MGKKRWAVDIKTRDGKSRQINIEEIEELHDIVEAGPSWDTLDKIVIRYLLGGPND